MFLLMFLGQLILQKGHAKQLSFTTQMLRNLTEYGMNMSNVISLTLAEETAVKVPGRYLGNSGLWLTSIWK